MGGPGHPRMACPRLAPNNTLGRATDLRSRHRQGAKNDVGTVRTKYPAKLLGTSMAFSNHRRIQFADATHASVLFFQGKWYVTDLPIPAGKSIVTTHTAIQLVHEEPAREQQATGME